MSNSLLDISALSQAISTLIKKLPKNKQWNPILSKLVEQDAPGVHRNTNLFLNKRILIFKSSFLKRSVLKAVATMALARN